MPCRSIDIGDIELFSIYWRISNAYFYLLLFRISCELGVVVARGIGEQNACVVEMVYKDIKSSSMEDTGTDNWYTFDLRIYHMYSAKPLTFCRRYDCA